MNISEETIIHSQEAEQAIIGAVLSDNSSFSGLDIEPSDFYIGKNRVIWKALNDLYRSSASLDLVTLTEKLKADGSENWVMYLSECITSTPSWANAKDYGNIIKEKATRRRLVQIASRIATAAHDKGSEIEKMLPTFIDQLSDTAKITNGAQHLKGFISKLYDEILLKSETPSDIWGLSTGFQNFDRITGGLQQGESMIVSGSPGVGKSILAMQLGINLGMKYPGAIYSMEMGAMQATRRIVSGHGRIPTRLLKTGRIADWDGLTKCVDELCQLPVWLSDSAGWTTTSLRADLSRLKAQQNISWFVLDYLYLLNDGGADEIERTSLASKGLKRICKDLNLAGIIIHSMTKGGMASEIPDQSDLRGSGQAVYDADLITFLTKFKPMSRQEEKIKEKDRENLRTLWFGKGRELEDPQRYIHFTKFQGFPAFAEAALDVPENEPAYYQK